MMNMHCIQKTKEIQTDLLYQSHLVFEQTTTDDYLVIKDKYDVIGKGKLVSENAIESLVNSEHRIAVLTLPKETVVFSNYPINQLSSSIN